jgi:hypothetical protein
MKFKLGYIKQVIKEEVQNLANEAEQKKDPYFEKSINVERPQELDKWFALLDMAKNHLPMACQANDPISQDIISGLDDIHGWLTKTFQGSEKIEDNPAYSGVMNESQDKALNALNSLKLYASKAEKLDTKEIMEYLNIIEREIKDIPKEIKPEIPGGIRPGSGPITFRPSSGVTIREGEEK